MELLPRSLRSLFPVGRLDMSTTGLLLLTNDGEFAQKVAHPRFGVEKTYVVTVRGVPDEATLGRARVGIRVKGQKLKVKSVEILGRLTPHPSPLPRKRDAPSPPSKGYPLTPALSPEGRGSDGGRASLWGRGSKRGEGVREERERARSMSPHPSPLPRGEWERKGKARLRVVLVEGKNREVRRLFQALGHRVLELHRSKVGSLTDRGLAIGSYRSLTSREVRSLSSPSRRK